MNPLNAGGDNRAIWAFNEKINLRLKRSFTTFLLNCRLARCETLIRWVIYDHLTEWNWQMRMKLNSLRASDKIHLTQWRTISRSSSQIRQRWTFWWNLIVDLANICTAISHTHQVGWVTLVVSHAFVECEATWASFSTASSANFGSTWNSFLPIEIPRKLVRLINIETFHNSA